jgi:hypothetical protein
MNTPMIPALDLAVAMLVTRGYRIEVSADGTEHRLVRPDGTVAMTARLDGGGVVRTPPGLEPLLNNHGRQLRTSENRSEG